MSRFGTVAAASLAAIAAAALSGSIGMLVATSVSDLGVLLFLVPLAAFFAALHLLVLGLPLYLYRAGRGPIGWADAGFAGLLVGGVPFPLLVFLGQARPWDIGRVADGLLWVLWLGGAGLIGGLAFRAALGDEAAA